MMDYATEIPVTRIAVEVCLYGTTVIGCRNLLSWTALMRANRL